MSKVIFLSFVMLFYFLFHFSKGYINREQSYPIKKEFPFLTLGPLFAIPCCCIVMVTDAICLGWTKSMPKIPVICSLPQLIIFPILRQILLLVNVPFSLRILTTLPLLEQMLLIIWPSMISSIALFSIPIASL